MIWSNGKGEYSVRLSDATVSDIGQTGNDEQATKKNIGVFVWNKWCAAFDTNKNYLQIQNKIKKKQHGNKS